MIERASLWNLDAKAYGRHSLHGNDRHWLESNCYVDLIIELLHAAGLEPTACLGSALASDFEGDQFTFFKPSFADLDRLYGVEILELNIWRSLAQQIALQLSRGRLLLVEMDAFHLPDTSGTDYKTSHTKTTVGIESIDLPAKKLGYFHNAGYFELQGDDFDGLFAAAAPPSLPPYVEMVRFDRKLQRSPAELARVSAELAREHLRKRPAQNPLAKYRAQFDRDLQWLLTVDLATYHQYAFSMVRQLGAAFELAGLYLRWLAANGAELAGLAAPAQDFLQISESAKSLIMKLARAVNAKRNVDVAALLSAMESSWQRGMDATVAQLGV